MNRLFAPDGALRNFLDKTGWIIIINLMWLVGCIPIVTIGTSTIAMYYAIVKSVRAECGYPVKEFWHAYKMNLLKGIVFLVIAAAGIFLLYINRNYMSDLGSVFGLVMFVVYDILAVLFAAMLAYAVPVLSRFNVKFSKYFKMILSMSMRHLLGTVGIVAGTVGIVILVGYFPVTVIFAPGVWCFLASFLAERAMREFMPEPEEGESAWYYDLGRKSGREQEEAPKEREENIIERKEGE